jgi:hypothetical protein
MMPEERFGARDTITSECQIERMKTGRVAGGSTFRSRAVGL